jgi:hypothetical protein
MTNQIIDYIDRLIDPDSFEGWPIVERNAYITACISIRKFIEDLEVNKGEIK